MDLAVAKIVVKVLDEYMNGEVDEKCMVAFGERMEPEQFLQGVFEQESYDDTVKDNVAEIFFKILKYEKLLDKAVQDYYKSKKSWVPKNDYCLLVVFLYYAIFELNEENRHRIENLMMNINTTKALALTKYMARDDFYSKVFARAVEIWDINYVRQQVLGSVQLSAIKALYDGITQIIENVRRSRIKPPTKPVQMKVLERRPRVKIPAYTKPNSADGRLQYTAEVPKVSSPRFEKITPTPVPKSTYVKPCYEKRLERDREEHRMRARALYDEAQTKQFRVAIKPKEKVVVVEDCLTKAAPSRRSRIPIMKEPAIQPRKNAAVILREGARLMKLEQEEIKRLDDIMKGAFNSESLKALEREIQEEKDRKHMEEIERKHLECLITYEEAILAKQNYIKKTKEAADEFRKEKEAWLKQLEDWKAEEQIRIRESFEKGKAYEKGAKEAVEHVKEEKHKLVLETMEESRNLKERLMEEREEDLKRKIQLIKEIKALQAFGLMKRKEAVPCEPAAIGLLCEMTTDELKERLLILRMEIKEEIDRRREEIKMKKECRRAIVDGYRELISQHQEISNYKKEQEKLDKCGKKVKTPRKSSSLEELKNKLIRIRKQRIRR